jgi:endonuclease/exonuclease/phosphatase family metal-dependent hydrolase
MTLKNMMFILCFGALHAAFLLFGETPAHRPNPAWKLMSFNIRRESTEKETKNLWKNRKNRVFDVIRENQPSILCLQEATIGQINDIAQKFPNYSWVGTGRGERYFGLAPSEYTPIFYDTKRFELQDQGTFSIGEGSSNPLRWKKEGKLPRIATWVLLTDKNSNLSFYLYNTHLDHIYDEVRQKGIVKIFEHMFEKQKPNLANHFVFLAGDFNTNLTAQKFRYNSTVYTTYESAFKEKYFVDTRKEAKTVSGPYNTAIDWHGKEKYCIDHILVRPIVKVGDIDDYDHMEIETTYPTIESHTTIQEKDPKLLPSDHRPVMITISPQP